LFDRLKKTLAPPVFNDPDLSRQARYLNVTLWVITVATAVVGVTLAVLAPDLTTPLLGAATLLVSQILALVFLHRANLKAATVLSIGATWLVFTWDVVFVSGIGGTSIIGQLLLVFLIGLGLDVRSAILLAALSVLANLGAVFTEQAGLISNISSGTSFSRWAMHTIYLMTGAIFVGIANRRMHLALADTRSAEQHYRQLFEQSNDAVLISDLDLKLNDLNRRAADLLGYRVEELIGKHLREIVAPDEWLEVIGKLPDIMAGGKLAAYERTLIRKDGQPVLTETSVALVNDPEGNPSYIQSIIRDITNRKGLQERLERSLSEMETLARTDPLTGLLNRRALLEHAEAELNRSRRSGSPMSVVMFDLDSLKSTNDRFGHLTGDGAIRLLAKVLRANKRQYDWAGRWGGDEFLLVLPGTVHTEAWEVANRIRQRIREVYLTLPEGDKLEINFSMGISSTSLLEHLPADIDTLLNQADQALYRAKEDGHGRVRIYDGS